MVIYDLICDLDHEFEGWFKNKEDYLSQQATGLLACPVCDSVQIEKRITAPNVGRKSNVIESKSLVPEQQNHDLLIGADNGETRDSEKFAQLQTMLGQVHDYIDQNFKDVGNRFAEEAISIKKGEKDAENIKGTVSQAQIKQLAEEGVEAIPLPPKPIDKKKIN